MLSVQPGRISFGFVKCSPPGSARPLLWSQPAFQFAPDPLARCSSDHKVSPGRTRTSLLEEGDAAVLPFADEVLRIPLAAPLFEPLLAVVPLHIFAMGLATAKGLDVDQPRNLAKSVTVE